MNKLKPVSSLRSEVDDIVTFTFPNSGELDRIFADLDKDEDYLDLEDFDGIEEFDEDSI